MDAVDRSTRAVTREIAFGSADYDAAVRLRDHVLRRPLGMVLSADDLHGEVDQVHLAAFADTTLVAICALKPLSADIVKLRQMAVAADRHGHGLGRALIGFAEHTALSRGFGRIEMDARIAAKGFYERLGYRAEGAPFLQIAIPHVKMSKRLTV